MAYDREAVKSKGLSAITNFDLSLYLDLLSPGGSRPWSHPHRASLWPHRKPCMHVRCVHVKSCACTTCWAAAR